LLVSVDERHTVERDAELNEFVAAGGMVLLARAGAD
jgi:hypothetical protein